MPEAGNLHELMQGRVTREVSDLRGTPGGHILFQPVTRLDISSSDIRARLAQGRSVRWLVPDAVRSMLQTTEAAAPK